jgi:hypothetical protein
MLAKSKRRGNHRPSSTFVPKAQKRLKSGIIPAMQDLLGFYAVLTGSWIRGLRISWDEIKNPEKTESRHNVHSQCVGYWQASI